MPLCRVRLSLLLNALTIQRWILLCHPSNTDKYLGLHSSSFFMHHFLPLLTLFVTYSFLTPLSTLPSSFYHYTSLSSLTPSFHFYKSPSIHSSLTPSSYHPFLPPFIFIHLIHLFLCYLLQAYDSFSIEAGTVEVTVGPGEALGIPFHVVSGKAVVWKVCHRSSWHLCDILVSTLEWYILRTHNILYRSYSSPSLKISVLAANLKTITLMHMHSKYTTPQIMMKSSDISFALKESVVQESGDCREVDIEHEKMVSSTL